MRAVRSAASFVNGASRRVRGSAERTRNRVAPIAGAAANAASRAAGSAKNAAGLPKRKMNRVIAKLKALLNQWVKAKIMLYGARLVDRIPGLTKDYLEDPDMPRCASRAKNRIVDAMWPDFREEILWELAVYLDGEGPEQMLVDDEGPGCVCAFLRYHLDPYDKGIWGKLRDPFWILIHFVELIPVFAISQSVLLFIFFVIDKKDEFQLISFILRFKGTQFISAGVLRTLLGFTLFMFCVSADADASEHSCERYGPGNGAHSLPAAFGFIVQVLLVWVAFLLLPYSTDKGRSSLKGAFQFEHTGLICQRGAYIRPLLWYDLIVFMLCATIVVCVMVIGAKEDYGHWSVAHLIYAMQIAYGLSSVPFFLFTLPGLQRVLTHAMPTAYDRLGRCQRFAKPPALVKRHAKGSSTEVVSDDETDELFGRMKSMFGSAGRLSGSDSDGGCLSGSDIDPDIDEINDPTSGATGAESDADVSSCTIENGRRKSGKPS